MVRLAWSLGLLSAAVLLSPLHSALAQPPQSPDVALAEPRVVELRLDPAAPPAAALKYRLLPPFAEQTPGNAVPLYYRAILFLSPGVRADAKQIDELLELPLEQMPLERARETVRRYHWALEEAQLAARREEADWGIPVRNNPDVYAIILEDVQQSRQLARLLALQIRVEIRERDFDAAIQNLKTGYALGQHVAEMPFVVSGLVGLAISNMMSDRIEELVTQPDAPNLYWALTALPGPLINFRKAIEFEMAAPLDMLPVLRDVETASRTPEQWQRELEELARRLDELMRSIGSGQRDEYAWQSPLALTAYALTAYPQAKQHLRERGYTVEQIERMPVAQAILIHLADVYLQRRDDIYKWFYVPYWKVPEEELEPASSTGVRRQNPLLAGLLSVNPFMKQARLAVARADRRIAELRIIEAIRLYAAEHGELPEQLSEIRQVPLPVDPVTGEPFEYSREGATAVLVVPPPPTSLREPVKRYRLSLRE